MSGCDQCSDRDAAMRYSVLAFLLAAALPGCAENSFGAPQWRDNAEAPCLAPAGDGAAADPAHPRPGLQRQGLTGQA
jgi:hypothetical protein